MTRADKLRMLAEKKDPQLQAERMLSEYAVALEDLFKEGREPGPQGEKGDKGDPGTMGPSGKDGKDGLDGAQGPQGVQGIQGEQGVAGRNGIDGAPGKDGKDGKDGVSPSIKSIITELRKLPIAYKDLEGAPDLTDLPKLIDFLKRGGFRGGGSTTINQGGGVVELSKTFTYNNDGTLHMESDTSGTKTFNYTAGVLTSITGTGAYKNKTFTYSAGVLQSITVS